MGASRPRSQSNDGVSASLSSGVRPQEAWNERRSFRDSKIVVGINPVTTEHPRATRPTAPAPLAWRSRACCRCDAWWPCTASQVSSVSRVMAAGRAGKEGQKRSTSAAVTRATSMRDGAFSRRLMVGYEQSARPLSGALPEASLNRGSARSASQSSASSHGTGFAGPRTGSTAGDRQHAKAEHGRKRVDHLRPIAPIADAACQGLG